MKYILLTLPFLHLIMFALPLMSRVIQSFKITNVFLQHAGKPNCAPGLKAMSKLMSHTVPLNNLLSTELIVGLGFISILSFMVSVFVSRGDSYHDGKKK